MKKKLFNLRIKVFPQRKRKITPAGRFVGQLLTGFVAAIICGTTAAILLTVGFTYAQLRERLDVPLRQAGVSNADRAYVALASQAKYLAEVQSLQTIGVAADDRVNELLARRSLEIERLQIDAAALRGRTDAEALKSFYVLRSRIGELPNLALPVPWTLLTSKWALFVGAVLAFYWFFLFMTIGPFVAKWSKRFDKALNRMAPAAA